MQFHRSVLVEAIIERPPPLPWVGDLPVPEPVASWPGTLLSWRWLDKDAGLWVAMVRYRRDGLLYEHAVNGELLTVLPDSAVIVDDCPTLNDEHEPDTAIIDTRRQ
jgi:hypothetical protein